jgi:hypothetical protein
MKRYGNIYEKIWDYENIKTAHAKAKRDKAHYSAVKRVDDSLDVYLFVVKELLKGKAYRVGEYKKQKIIDKGKERELSKLPYFPDRIIQWAILLQTEHIFLSVLINFTCASLKNRGIHYASKLLDSYMQNKEETKYCLKIDIKKFYPNIDHEILKSLLRKKFKDKDLLWLFDLIIDSTNEDKGIPIGSYLSQYFANYYLAWFDHWLKEVCGCKYVVRYMDDIVILHESKEFLHSLKRKMDDYLETNLKLKIKENWQVFPTGVRGVDFVGYRHFYGYKLLRKTTAKRYKKKMRMIKKKQSKRYKLTKSDLHSISSYKGWLDWCDSYRLKEKYAIRTEE